MSSISELSDARYVSLETFRKDGAGVKTPVWVARAAHDLVVFTNADSYKVKRLRRNSTLRVAECTMRGQIMGPWYEAKGRVVEDAALERAAYRALRKKYTWQMLLAELGGRISRRSKRWVVLAINLND